MSVFPEFLLSVAVQAATCLLMYCVCQYSMLAPPAVQYMYSMLAPSVGQCMPEQYACLDGLVCTMCTPYKPLVYFMGLYLAGAVDKLP